MATISPSTGSSRSPPGVDDSSLAVGLGISIRGHARQPPLRAGEHASLCSALGECPLGLDIFDEFLVFVDALVRGGELALEAFVLGFEPGDSSLVFSNLLVVFMPRCECIADVFTSCSAVFIALCFEALDNILIESDGDILHSRETHPCSLSNTSDAPRRRRPRGRDRDPQPRPLNEAP